MVLTNFLFSVTISSMCLQNGRSGDNVRQSNVLPDLLSQASGSPGTPSARDKSQSEEVSFLLNDANTFGASCFYCDNTICFLTLSSLKPCLDGIKVYVKTWENLLNILTKICLIALKHSATIKYDDDESILQIFSLMSSVKQFFRLY